MKFTFKNFPAAIDQISRAFDELAKSTIKATKGIAVIASGADLVTATTDLAVRSFTPAPGVLYICVPRQIDANGTRELCGTGGTGQTAGINGAVLFLANGSAQAYISNSGAVDHSVSWALLAVTA